MAYSGTDTSEEPIFLSDETLPPVHDRRWFDDIMRDGIIGTSDLLVSAGTIRNVNITSGKALVLGQNVSDQGLYRVRQPGNYVGYAILAAGDPSNPRIDQAILRVFDADHDTSGVRKGRLEIVPGVPTAGATLANRNGAADLTALTDNSKNVLLLSDILVPIGAATSAGCTFRDRRKLAWPKNVPYVTKDPTVQSISGAGTIQVAAGGIPGYLLRDADYDLTKARRIKITINGLMENSSGASRTTVWEFGMSRGGGAASTWSDTSIAIPATSAGIMRVIKWEIDILVALRPGSSNVEAYGNIAVSGQPSAFGWGDIGALPLLNNPFALSGGPITPASAINNDISWYIATTHSSSLATFNEQTNLIVTEIW